MLNTGERISKSLIQLQKRCSFWAYLSLFLKFHEIEAGKMLCDTMGISPDGEVFYVKEFIKSLSDEELIGAIVHELNHLAFLTELRQGDRDRVKWNFSSDLSINSILKANNFKLGKDWLTPDYNDEFKIGSKTIKDISKKTSEELYDEIPSIKMKGVKYILGDGSGKKLGESFDVHLKGKDGKELSPKEKKALEKEWMDRVAGAVIVSKEKGDIPKGMERLVEKLTESKINWKVLLQRYIQNSIPHDFSYNRPHRKSISCGYYMPNIVREGIEIALMVDLSGSIGSKEYSEFISEVIGICRAYQEKLTMKVFSHDTECYDDNLVIKNGNIEKVKNLRLKGGGGTSHKSCFNHLRDNVRDCKLAIFLTDGYSDINEISFENYQYDKLFVITKNGSDDQLKGKRCQIIHLKD